jgi:hypothetical protein
MVLLGAKGRVVLGKKKEKKQGNELYLVVKGRLW